MPVVLSGRSLLVGSNFQRTSAPSDICIFFRLGNAKKNGHSNPRARRKKKVVRRFNLELGHPVHSFVACASD